MENRGYFNHSFWPMDNIGISICRTDNGFFLYGKKGSRKSKVLDVMEKKDILITDKKTIKNLRRISFIKTYNPYL